MRNSKFRNGCRHVRGSHTGSLCEGIGCHIDIVGAGKENYPFPSASVLVSRALSRAGLNGPDSGVQTTTDTNQTVEDVVGSDFWKNVKDLIPKIQVDESDLEQFAMAHGAEGLRLLMEDRRFDGLIDVRFSHMIGAVNWAKQSMPKGFKKPLRNLGRQITKLKNRYKKAMRQLTAKLSEKRPQASFDDLVEEATNLLDTEMEEVLTILQVYTDSLAQYRDGIYTRHLELINLFFEQSALLFHTVNPCDDDKASENCDEEPVRQLNTRAFKVGDKYVARIVAGELATIPGSLGPVGMHSLEVPVEMLDFVFLLMPILAHELFHDIYYDVKGLEEELEAKVEAAIREAVATGAVTLSQENTPFGAKQVATVDLLVKLYRDLLSEIAADVCGGILLSGPAFVTSVLSAFPAMGMGAKEVTDVPRMLYTSSEFELTEKKGDKLELTFEPHPADYVRVLGLAQVLDGMGFSDEAAKFNSLAHFGAGSPTPSHIVYKDSAGREDLTLRFAVCDLQKLFPIVANVLIGTKLDSLDGRSMQEMYNWTAARQRKVDVLAAQLEAGKYAIPRSLGTVYSTYVGAAAPTAYWNMVKAGIEPVKAAKSVNRNAMRMLGTLLRRAED